MMARGKSLQDAHRAAIVRELACYATPKQAAEALKAEFGIEVSPQATERYDPTKRAGQKVPKKWREMFHEVRKAFLEHIESSVPSANKAVRVAKLSRAADSLEARGNLVGMKEMLEAVAKEMGNVHTNKRELTGKGGGPITFADLTDEEIDSKLKRMIAVLGEDGAGDAEGGGDDGKA